MGVRGLQTYLEHYCPDACYQVHLRSLLSEHRSKTGHQPEIVIDAQSCYKMWARGIDWTIGFEMQEFIYRLRTFVEAFLKAGAKLVFYFGGLTPRKKRSVWIERRTRNISDTFKVFDLFYNGKLFKDLPKELESIPPNMGIITSFILKYILNCTVYMSVEECDEEIIHYVHEHDSFAIFAQDTDFIVSQVQCLVLSSNNFDVDKMTTLLYDRRKLIDCLNIENDQLPLLAVLAGNDLLPHDALRVFHVDVCRLPNDRYIPFQVLMPTLGKYINQLPKVCIDKVLEFICYDVFKDYSKLDDVKLSYNSYLIHQKPSSGPSADRWTQILRIAKYRMKNIVMPLFVWSVMNDHVFEIAIAFEDLRKNHDKCEKPHETPSATISRPLRQRLYGILLYEKHDESILVEEWCGENERSYRAPVKVQPIYPSVHHPGLLALWSEDNGERLNQHKWMLFLHTISPKIRHTRDWSLLDEDTVVSVATCYYLLEQKYLSKWELHAILATIALHPLYNRTKLCSLPSNKPDMRAIQLSVTFIRTYGIVLSLLAACGFPVPMTQNIALIKLEGKLFQVKYREARQNIRYKELCDKDDVTLRFFYQMKNIIYRDPPKQKNSNAEKEPSGKTEDSSANKSLTSRFTKSRSLLTRW